MRADIRRGMEGADGVEMRGRVVVITGANSGIGKELATYAAAKGAKVIMMCRSVERGEAALQEIQAKTSNPCMQLVIGDVSELSQVRSAV